MRGCPRCTCRWQIKESFLSALLSKSFESFTHSLSLSPFSGSFLPEIRRRNHRIYRCRCQIRRWWYWSASTLQRAKVRERWAHCRAPSCRPCASSSPDRSGVSLRLTQELKAQSNGYILIIQSPHQSKFSGGRSGRRDDRWGLLLPEFGCP